MHPSQDTQKSNVRGAYDLLIVGGGLAGGLLAWRLKSIRPQLKFLLLESSSRLGGDHTWCFHENDLSASQFEWIKPLVSRSWEGHTVRFPENDRHECRGNYHAIRSHDFDQILKQQLGDRVRFGEKVKSMSPNSVELENGERLQSDVVIDASGMANVEKIDCGWQKFVGLDLTLSQPHGLKKPILMDADLEQIDGFRFMYALPWDEKKLLLEDTLYSSNSKVDSGEFQTRILNYAKKSGWQVESIDRREVGCLPIPISRLPQGGMRGDDAPAIGTAAGFFHMTTGYSLPDAVRLIDLIVVIETLNPENVRSVIREYRQQWEPRQNFYRFLNRMLFYAAEPEKRYRVLQRFYRLNESVVNRFYAGETSGFDRVKILTGKPPVPVRRAISCFFDHAKGSGE